MALLDALARLANSTFSNVSGVSVSFQLPPQVRGRMGTTEARHRQNAGPNGRGCGSRVGKLTTPGSATWHPAPVSKARAVP
jgi:hypothetical protein